MLTHTIPVLSNEHIDQSDVWQLEGDNYVDHPDMTKVEIAVYPKGAFIRLCDIEDECVEALPPSMKEVRAWAIQKGYSDWIRFDPAGKEIEELPTYCWKYLF